MAKSKVINTVLQLKDQMSGGLLKAARNTKGVTKEMQTATRQVVAFKNKAVSSVNSAVKSFSKLALGAGAAATALAAKVGFSEALDLEGYRLQLETATKDTQKASKIMAYAVGLANKTPFEGGQMVEAAAKFESMGMSAETWLTRAGDMAAATNKDMDQAVEALIDAQTGELERLKEFGITKAMVLAKGEKMFRGVQIANNQGSIVDQQKFNEAMIALMNDKYAGGMEKMASTTKGLWSTVTGITKSSLAKIVGVSEDGSIRTGSALDLVKGKVSTLAEKLQQWQSDGTIDRLSDKLNNGLAWASEKASQAFQWFRNNGDTLIGVIKGIAGAFAVAKVLQFVSGVIQSVQTIGLFAKVAAGFVAANPIVLGIAAAIAAGVLLIANWDKVKKYAGELCDCAKNAFGGLAQGVKDIFNGLKEVIGKFFSWLDDKLESIPILGDLYKGAKTGLKSLGSWIGDGVGSLIDSASKPMNESSSTTTTATKATSPSPMFMPQSNTKTSPDMLIPQLPGLGKALGTSYWRGGLTRVNERGGEVMNLPSGTQIIPHDVSKRMGGQSVDVKVYIQGNVIGNDQFADQVGERVTRKIVRALANT